MGISEKNDKKEKFIEQILDQNGIYCIGDGSGVDSFEYSGFKAFSIWASRETAETSEEAFDFTVGGINIYELTYYTLPYLIESTRIRNVALCTDEGDMYVMPMEELQSELMDMLQSRLEGDDISPYEHFTDDTFDTAASAAGMSEPTDASEAAGYEYFLNAITYYNKIWCLVDEEAGLLTDTNDDGEEILIVWPDAQSASHFAERMLPAGGAGVSYVAEWVNPFEFVFRVMPSFERISGAREAGIAVCVSEVYSGNNKDARYIYRTSDVFRDNLLHALYHRHEGV